MLKINEVFGLLVPEYLLITTFALVSAGIYFKLPELYNIIIIFFIVSGYTLSLNVLNNIIDSDLDKKIKPQRPIPSGKISIRKALLVYFLLILISLVFCIFYSIQILLLLLISIFLGVLYSIKPVRLKDRLFGPSLVGGLLYGGIPAMMLSIVYFGSIDYLFSLLLFLLVFSIAPIKDIEDYKEKKYGGNNIAIIFGKSKTILFTISLLIISLIIYSGLAIYLNKKINLIIISALCVLILMFYFTFAKKYVEKKSVMSQSKLVSMFMILIIIIEIIIALTNIYI